ncbi:hypothetical protein KIW84_064613 [Lathyrus oleraceus]|uniref:Uncharacterized protein n=1 Tax=Pisum sativum TaxID=3888 RepID=A0A9D4WEU6_PEA|nr:hypothetical protein KIW84_064613 [Pisum sativum]
MLQKFCLMASYGFPSELGFQQEFVMKGCQQLVPYHVAKPEIVRYQCPNLRLNSYEESRMASREWFGSNQFVNLELSALKPMVVDVQATCPSTLLFSFGAVDQCTEHDKTLHCITSEAAEAVTESYLSESTHKGEKQFMLVPHFSRLNQNEVEARSHSSTLDIHSTLTVPLKSLEKVKVKPSRKKNKKVARERDLFKKNYIHACESLLFLMTDKSHHRETAILSLKKSGPELPELLTQFSAGIAGAGLAVVLSVICKLACGRVPFCASKVFNTGLGFGLVWLSWGVNKLRNTIVNISKNTGKMRLKDEDMIQKVDKSLKEVYFRAAALLVVAVLRLA